MVSDAMETGTVQINSAPARGPDHFPFQVRCSHFFASSNSRHLAELLADYSKTAQGLRDSGIGSQGITNSINMMTKTKSTVVNLPSASYTLG